MRSAPVYLVRRHRGFVPCVALKVTQHDIDLHGLFVDKPGVYLFRGAWYGSDLTNIDTYGKIEGRLDLQLHPRRQGRVSSCMTRADVRRFQ